jgi:hypothetical protein
VTATATPIDESLQAKPSQVVTRFKMLGWRDVHSRSQVPAIMAETFIDLIDEQIEAAPESDPINTDMPDIALLCKLLREDIEDYMSNILRIDGTTQEEYEEV